MASTVATTRDRNGMNSRDGTWGRRGRLTLLGAYNRKVLCGMYCPSWKGAIRSFTIALAFSVIGPFI